MTSAYDHQIMSGVYQWQMVRLPEGGFESRKVAVEPEQKSHWVYPERLVWKPGCYGLGCPERPEYTVTYRYATGRPGRTTRRDAYYCVYHAERFARRHGLTMPPQGRSDE